MSVFFILILKSAQSANTNKTRPDVFVDHVYGIDWSEESMEVTTLFAYRVEDAWADRVYVVCVCDCWNAGRA